MNLTILLAIITRSFLSETIKGYEQIIVVVGKTHDESVVTVPELGFELTALT